MTEDEAKKLVVGDVVLVRGVVRDLGSQYPHGDLLLNLENKGDGLQQTRIPRCAIHSVLPRPLAVGDRVKHEGLSGEIKCADGDWFWVRFGEGHHLTLSANELERAP